MTVASIASAAVVSGELILGLADGQIIRAGYVQGPTGKTGPEGAMGSTGPRGADGNTILHGMEKPQGSDGKDGDFYIWTREWFIYGPKTSGQWGTGTNMLAPKEYFKSNPNQSGGGGTAPSSEGGGGSTGSVFSNQVYLSGTGRAITAPGGNIIPEGKDLSVQSNLNKWIENSLRVLDEALPVKAVDTLPDAGDYDGDMVVHDGSLHVWINGAWLEIAGGSGEPGKESQPYIDYSQFKVIERTDRFDYDPIFAVNPIAQYLWRYELDLQNDGNFVDVTTLDRSVQEAIGWYGSISTSHLRLKKTADQVGTYPNARVRFVIWSELNGVENEEGTCDLLAWEDNECNYSFDPLTLEERVAIGESRQENIVNEIANALSTQSEIIQQLDELPTTVSNTAPADPKEGDLWYDNSSNVIELFIYVDGAWASATPASEYALESRIAANEEGIRDLWSDQQRQDLEFGALESRVDQLEGVVGEYTYTFQTGNQTPRDGQMSLLKADMTTTTRWEDAESLVFNPTTLSGGTFEQSEIVTGDVIRLHVQGDIGMQVSAFEAKVIQNNNGLLTIDQKVKIVGTGMNNTTYEVFHLSSYDPSGLATMDYVDAQDALLGTMINENGKEINKKLGKTDANVVNNNFRIKSDTKTYISTSGGQLALNHVKEPTAGHNVATKDYVDSKSGGVGIAPPAPLRWIWRNYDSTIDPGEGKFAWNSGSGFFRINYITADGINLGKSRPSTVDINLDTKLTGSIWYKDGDGWKLKQMFDVYRMQWDRNDCIWLYRSSIIVGADEFTADVQYHITVGGFF